MKEEDKLKKVKKEKKEVKKAKKGKVATKTVMSYVTPLSN